MAESSPEKRSFPCSLCHKAISIPADLPPTTGPCPHCGQTVTSPTLRSLEVEESVRGDKAKKKPETKAPIRWMMPVGLVVGGLTVLVGLLLFKKLKTPVQPSMTQVDVIEKGQVPEADPAMWRREAAATLEGFFQAKTVEERAQWVIGGEAILPELKEFYQDSLMDEEDSPLEAFSAVTVGEEDLKRGLYLMVYDRPAQFEISEFFRPIVPMAVRYELEPPDMILQVEADMQNFVADAVRVLAFFKETPQGLKLDWKTYVQTKYRLLDEFVSSREPGRSGDFRVVISQDIDGREKVGETVYRLADPANEDVFAKVVVSDASDLGQVLAPLKWRGKVVTGFPTRNATVRLAWTDESSPSLKLDGLLCWEFLGLGGELGNWKKGD